MVNYVHAVIYRIINKESGENLYIGSTTDYNRRMIEHKSRCHNSKTHHYNLPLYKYIREELGGWDFARMVLVEEVIGCQNKMQLVKREQFFIDSYNESKNAIRSYVTDEQKKEEKTQYKKQYYIDNSDKIKEQTKQYYASHKEQKKQYSIDNKEQIKEKARIRYLKKKNEQPELVQSTTL